MSNSTTTEGNITEDGIYEMLKHREYITIVLYFIVFFAALVANLILIIIVVKDRYMQNVTNYFLVNLSVADLLVTIICMPNAAWGAYTDAYTFGEDTCKIIAYLQGISVGSSIFTITTMAVDRYMAIIKPFGLRYRCFNRKSTIIMITILWTFSLILFSPNLWIAGLTVIQGDITMCRMNFKDAPIPQGVIGVIWFLFMFAIPGCIMIFAYSVMGKTLCAALPPLDNNESSCTRQRIRVMKSRRRVACILLLLAIVFAVCWLPYHIISLVISLKADNKYETATRYLLLLGHTNSALNPIIYCILSKKFRSSTTKLLKCNMIMFLRKQQNPNMWIADSSGSGFQVPANNKATPLTHRLNGDVLMSRSSQKTRTFAV